MGREMLDSESQATSAMDAISIQWSHGDFIDGAAIKNRK